TAPWASPTATGSTWTRTTSSSSTRPARTPAPTTAAPKPAPPTPSPTNPLLPQAGEGAPRSGADEGAPFPDAKPPHPPTPRHLAPHQHRGMRDPKSIPRARHLRRNQTEVERQLWRLLRDRRLEGFKFRRQHPIGPYFADFACIAEGLVVEADGGQHLDQAAYDQTRTRFL